MTNIVSLTISTNDALHTDHAWYVLSIMGRDMLREGYDAVISAHKIDSKSQDDSKRMLTWKVHNTLTRLGMTETEAWTAITEIHKADIIFAKKDA